MIGQWVLMDHTVIDDTCADPNHRDDEQDLSRRHAAYFPS